MQPSLFQTGHLNVNPIMFDFGNEEVVPAPVIPPMPLPDPNRLTKFGGKSHSEVIAAWETLPPDVKHGRLRLTFDQPFALHLNRRKLSDPKKVHDFRLFVGKGTNCLCYTNSSRTGFYFDDRHLQRLVSIEPVPEGNMVEKVRKLANRIYPGVWDDLKAKLLADPQKYLSNYGYTVTSISGKFPDYVLADIKSAFENRSNYTYDTGGYFSRKKTGRDLKVECKLCDDGIYRAWFSSEFPGCANGDYWLLINPTTAAFKERD